MQSFGDSIRDFFMAFVLAVFFLASYFFAAILKKEEAEDFRFLRLTAFNPSAAPSSSAKRHVLLGIPLTWV